MFTQASVRNFQSIRDITVDLEPLTVLVGASNSGKSALLRALRMLAFNTNSPSVVRLGEKSATVSLVREDKTSASIERGKSLSTYTLGSPESSEEYVKSGTSVPEPVQDWFRFPATPDGDPYNFSFQFDSPFMLSTTGSKIAKALGELSNVTVLLDAAREARRRKLSVVGDLKVRRQDVLELTDSLNGYRDLPEQKQALTEAEALFDVAQKAEDRASLLRDTIEKVEVAGGAYKRLNETLPKIPDESLVTEARARVLKWESLESLVNDLQRTAQALSREMTSLKEDEAELKDLHERRHSLLAEEGSCPMCGQKVTTDAA